MSEWCSQCAEVMCLQAKHKSHWNTNSDRTLQSTLIYRSCASSIYLSIYLFIYLSIYTSIHPSMEVPRDFQAALLEKDCTNLIYMRGQHERRLCSQKQKCGIQLQDNLLRTDDLKVKLLGHAFKLYVWWKDHHANCGGSSIVIWGCFAALGPDKLFYHNVSYEFHIILKSAWGE